MAANEMKLAPGFELFEASHDEVPALFQVMEDAFGTEDELWKIIFADVEVKEVQPWLMEHLALRWKLPDIKCFKIVDQSNSNIAGWTALQYPWKYVPEMTDEFKALAMSEDMPGPAKGMNLEALRELFVCLSCAKDHGYNPEEDYHRKGTMIHPDYQKKGFGTYVTLHCNAISDKSRDKTWVPARPSSHKMFNTCGFKDIGTVDAHLERWGGSREKSTTWCLLREAPFVAA